MEINAERHERLCLASEWQVDGIREHREVGDREVIGEKCPCQKQSSSTQSLNVHTPSPCIKPAILCHHTVPVLCPRPSCFVNEEYNTTDQPI